MSDDTSKKNQPPKRCMKEGCRCKLKLTDYPCRCGKYFCGDHRIAECHECTFDYRALNRENLLKFMSTAVVGEKVAII